MSLLDGAEDVRVVPAVPVDDGYGGTVPGEGAPVVIRARVVPSDSAEPGPAGYLADPTYRLYTRAFPAGPWSRVEWAGQTWSVVGAPQRYGGGSRTAHDVVMIRKRG
ncbi:hypothetical protein I5Q34_19850 [Streptomyces sp. AV19]|uniref:hypothetical protein n=1 Tax=Streptomyces sp. AV19 TaxID=2793068 RepID=UPI0018FF09A0|nr:hypothetical protein [Streptomyces sp. AV19]MBH1936503.1 hypothetical protein [Streptomyces sp. AV19]MDG4532560.1 hypothetical protein [Streptomyces sp. AV19]